LPEVEKQVLGGVSKRDEGASHKTKLRQKKTKGEGRQSPRIFRVAKRGGRKKKLKGDSKTWYTKRNREISSPKKS